jgi:chromosome segregation ATPase
MTIVAFTLLALTCIALLAVIAINQRLAKQVRESDSKVENAIAEVTAALEQKKALYDAAVEESRIHFESEAKRVRDESEEEIRQLRDQLAALNEIAELQVTHRNVKEMLANALSEVEALRAESAALEEHVHGEIATERSEAQKRIRELVHQAEVALNRATQDAGKIVAKAEQRALGIAGDALVALREKETLEDAITALKNLVNGYGDSYVTPTHSLLDDLADDFGHTAAGERLKAARDMTRRMVEQGQAAECNYVEPTRKATAVRFVVDAFNGRVDAILSRVKHSNHGTLNQEIKDAFALVNLNGQAFRDARLLDAYLDARLDELKWAVVVQELRLKEREEQRRIQEQIREEERARREYEKAIQEAARDEETLKKAMQKAREEAATANAAEREKLETQLAILQQRLTEAEAKSQRALSMAQQTRSGHVYVISNEGSFGQHVFKIGLTRRLEPLDRIRELGDASVPFPFDVHAMIYRTMLPL